MCAMCGACLQYVVECHADTLLPQYLGMYRIKVNDADAHCFIVMRSVFSPRVAVHKIYDLKVNVISYISYIFTSIAYQ